MKLLVTGSDGQLGSELKRVLPDAVFVGKSALNIADAESVTQFVKSAHIDAIINCAAYTAVDKAEDDDQLCAAVNADGPRNLARTGAKIVHISTDYVFDGLNHRPYNEDDKTNPLSVYGRTKLAGELAVLDNAQTAIIIRTSWMYSTFGNNFVKTMRRLGMEKESLNVIFDQIGTPTYATGLAGVIAQILPQIKSGTKEVYHFSDEGVCSWYDFAHEIMSQSGLPCKVIPIEGSGYPSRAVRPFYSVLNKSKIKRDFNLTISYWKENLAQCLKQF